MSTPYIGEIKLVPYNFAPRGWAFCDGQLLQISQHDALFALLGTIYGGDGRTTFALPDLRGRAAIHYGTGPGLQPYSLGQGAGVETVAVSESQMAAHAHSLGVAASIGTQGSPGGHVRATSPMALGYANAGASNANMAVPVGLTGDGQPHDNMQPYVVLNYVMALEGIFPSRN